MKGFEEVRPGGARLARLLLPLAVLFLATSAAFGADKPKDDPNAACLECHGDPKTKSESGKSILVDVGRFGASVHGEANVECTECHTDPAATEDPHPKKLKAPDCASCHEDAVKEHEASGHAKVRADGKPGATCSSCHGGMHDMHASKNPESRTHFRNLAATCGACHGDDKVIKDAKLPGGNVVARYHDSIHGEKLRAVAGQKQGEVPTCKDCHGAHKILAKSDPESTVSRAKSTETCGSCHQRIKLAFDGGKHGKLLAKGKSSAPGCSDCHSAHAVQRHDLPKWQVAVINECGTCHEDFLKTYRDTFHGKVTELGYTRVATCASCHGAHDVRPASDPASPVSPENRLATCQKCHAGVNANFAAWDPHADRHDRSRNPILYYAGLFMDALLAGVFLFFGIHTALWFVRSLRVVRERRQSGGEGKEG